MEVPSINVINPVSYILVAIYLVYQKETPLTEVKGVSTIKLYTKLILNKGIRLVVLLQLCLQLFCQQSFRMNQYYLVVDGMTRRT